MSRGSASGPSAMSGVGWLACLGLLPALLHIPALCQVALSALPPATDRRIDFATEVAPLLEQRCQSCHGEALQSSGLRLDSREAALRGGYSGPVILPGNSQESKLIQMVAGLRKDLVMPMSGDRLAPGQVGMLRAWIDQGAEWPEPQAAENPAAIQPQAKTMHWAFIGPRRPALPDVENSGWVRNPIDRFVLAKLEAQGIQPSPQAERPTLIRRLSLDLIGLPPTPEEVDAFVNLIPYYVHPSRAPEGVGLVDFRWLARSRQAGGRGARHEMHWQPVVSVATGSPGQSPDGPRGVPAACPTRSRVVERPVDRAGGSRCR